MEAIKQKMQDFHAIIIGDITAECRNDLLKYCYMCEKRAYVVPKLSDLILMGAERIHVFDTPFLLSRGYALSFDERLLKRLLDLVLSFVLLVVTSPILVLVSAAVKICDGGPVFYRQVRCTKDDQLFTIIKFRSMVVDAESSEGPVLASRHDDRVTVVGRFLRASRLDELPQLFNILKGDMSFVGPRPERPEMIQAYERDMPEFRFRTRVKAGLTGYAQVYGKYNTSPYDKLKLDLFYIENCVTEKKYDDIIPYSKEIMHDLESRYCTINTGNLVIDAFVSNLLLQTKAQGITLHTNLKFDKATIPVNDYHLTIILGNLLDNALNACRGQIGANIKVAVRTVDGTFTIHVANTYVIADPDKAPDDFEKIDFIHGYGLKNVKDSAEACGGFCVINHENDIYSATVIIPVLNP